MKNKWILCFGFGLIPKIIHYVHVNITKSGKKKFPNPKYRANSSKCSACFRAGENKCWGAILFLTSGVLGG
jgi:hypothetical protein